MKGYLLKSRNEKQKEKSIDLLNGKNLSENPEKSGNTNKFKKQNQFTEEENKFFSAEQSLQHPFKSHKLYNSFSNLSLQSVLFFAFTDPSFLSVFRFLDPLQFNELSLMNIFSAKQLSSQLSYTYRKYRPSLTFSLIYDQGFIGGERGGYQNEFFKPFIFKLFRTSNFGGALAQNYLLKKKDPISYRDRAFNIAFHYPLIIKNYWKLSLISSFQLGQEQFNNEGKYLSKYFPVLFYKSQFWNSYIGHRGGISYNFERKYKYAYFFRKKRTLELSYSIMHTEMKPKLYNTYLTGHIQAFFVEELGKEWFVTLNGVARRKLWDKELLLKHQEETSLNYSSFKPYTKDLYRFQFQILKVFKLLLLSFKNSFSFKALCSFDRSVFFVV